MNRTTKNRKTNSKRLFGKIALFLTVALVMTMIIPFTISAAETADFSGTWEIEAEGTDQVVTWSLNQSGNRVTGVYQFFGSELEIIGTVSGNVLNGDISGTHPFSGQPTVEAFSVIMVADGQFADTTEPQKVVGRRIAGGAGQSSPAPPTSPPASAETSAIQLTATAVGQSIDLSWNAPTGSKTVSGYYLYRGTASGQQSVYPLTDFTVTGTIHRDTPAAAGTYYYTVRPVFSDSTVGSSSSEAKATIGTSAPAGGITLVLQVGVTTMYKNGAPLPVAVPPELKDGRVFVPFRAVAEGLGGTVDYDGTDRKVTISLGQNSIQLWLGRSSAVVNGQTVTLDAVPYISNGSTMVPLRFVTANLGCQVEWDGTTRKVTITYEAGPSGAPAGGSPTPPPTSPDSPSTAVDFSGTWQLTVRTEDGGYTDYDVMTLSQNGNVVTGYAGDDLSARHQFNGTVSGNILKGTFSTTDPVTEWRFEATLSADGQRFDGIEYYSNPAYVIHGEKQ